MKFDMNFSRSKRAQFAPAYDQAQIRTGETNNTTGGKVLVKANDVCVEGVSGSFFHVKHDFRLQGNQGNDDSSISKSLAETEKEVGPPNKFRFLICTVALSALSLNLMSRIILNIAIVEMTEKVKRDDLQPIDDTLSQETITTNLLSTTPDDSYVSNGASSNVIDRPKLGEQHLDSLHFDWSAKEKNFLISAFYIGYVPSMMVSGGLADKYGAKYILLLTVVGSSIVNLVTPYIAGLSLYLLIGSRIFLGILQGGVVPASYGLFNKWLTMTETSIFVPLTKVSFALGSLIGASLPGITKFLGYEWPFLFHVASFFCAIFALVWYPISTSTPQTNKFVSPEELRWIMRKKEQEKSADTKQTKQHDNKNQQPQQPATPQPPWLLIIKNPSVLALTLVKLTYNIGIDFVCLELSIYLKAIYDTPTMTISAIASGACFMQLILVTFVGWAAKVLVNNRSCGLSRTKWRKIFQGAANFLMAFMFLALTFADQMWLAVVLLYMICFFWMLGAGGESMVPYDLSERYPATIVGVAQSFSVLSGFIVPTLCSLLLGNDDKDPKQWNFMFYSLACGLFVGGMVFVFVVKAKPFLPGEKVDKAPKMIVVVNSQQVGHQS